MNNFIFKNFVKLNENEKKLILKWRNSNRVRLKMNQQDVISLDSHLRWINTLKERRDYEYYLFYVNNLPAGVFNFANIKNGECECGSYIGNEDFIGYGILLNYLGFCHAFDELSIKRINITVLKNNKRVYQMHKTIFKAKDCSNNENKYFLYINKDDWYYNTNNISEIISGFYSQTLSVDWSN